MDTKNASSMKRMGLILMLWFAFGCGERADRSRNQEGSNERGSEPIVLLLLKTSDNPFFRAIEQGVREQAQTSWKDMRLDVRAGANEGDVSTQKRLLDEYFQRYVAGRDVPLLAGVLLTPSGSSDQLTSEIARLNQHKIPIVLVDTKIEEDALRRANARYDSYIGSDNQLGGRLAAELIRRHLPNGGRVLVLNGVQGHETATQRRNGFLGAIQQPSGQFIIEERTGNWRRSEARSMVDALLTTGRSVDAVFAANDEMALGVIEAFRQHTQARRPAAVVGFDATDEARQVIETGALTATVAQQPALMGRRALQTLVSLRNGQEILRDQVIPVEVVQRRQQ